MTDYWTVVSDSPKVMVAYEGGKKYCIYQQGKDVERWTVRVMYNPNDENEPTWCDLVKPVVCSSLWKAILQAESCSPFGRKMESWSVG
jgi:hypothetical protein